MRFVLPVSLLLLSGPLTGYTQDAVADGDPIRTDIEALHAPSSPAFGILDLNPSSIARPISPKEFKTSLLSSIAESDSAIPGNLALEITPFWWKSRPDVTFKRLYEEPETALTIKQSMSLSLATVTRDQSQDSESTDIALGFRFSIVPGKLSRTSQNLKDEVYAKNKAFNEALLKVRGEQSCKDAIRNKSPDEAAKICAEAAKPELAAADEAVQNFQSSLNKREGLQLDIASAVAYSIPANDSSERTFSKGGLWATATYTPGNGERGGYQFLGITRYLREKSPVTRKNDNLLDAGVRMIWQHGEYPVALSVEYINRFRDKGSNSERYAGVFEYRISNTLSLTTSVGKNFKEEGAKEDLFVLGGLNFNLGKGPVVRFDRSDR